MENCNFCSIIKKEKTEVIADTILLETTNFFVTTTLGCLTKNYIMIISKKHIVSMCYLEKEEQKELTNLIEVFKKIFRSEYGFYPLIFEHGASNCDINKSSCCILHAHIHIVPHMLNNKDRMIEKLGLIRENEYNSFFESAYNVPYLLFIDNNENIYMRNLVSSVAPSQIIRKWISKDMGIAEKWDWRIYPFSKNIISTVREMGFLIKNKYRRMFDLLFDIYDEIGDI